MSSWTNKDLYVAYSFATSDVNGYYFPDTIENYWYNSANNVSLIYSGNNWWLRERIATNYTHYYYGALDSGSGICNNLIFASNSVYGICSGVLPIGNIIYAGTYAESSSSSSSESSESLGWTSSSSSSSSSANTESSSTESPEVETVGLFQTTIHQGHHDIIPFSFIIERGQESNVASSNATLGFSFVQTANNISYKKLLDFNTISAETTTTFVPESDESKYKHEPIFYVDLIVEGQGINEYSLRAQNNMYIKEKPTMTFNIPKFSWNNSIFGTSDSSESSADPKEGYVMIGTNDKSIKKVNYSIDYARVEASFSTPSEVYKIIAGQQDSNTYVTCYDNLLIYENASYYASRDEFQLKVDILNKTNDLVVLDDVQSGNLICVESYQGNVIFRNRNDLSVVSTYSGFDAPFKVVWSKTHNCYFIAGTYTLWKLQNGVKTAVYNIKDYAIVDFDCSERGVVGIILKKQNEYLVRFLAKNLYTMIYSETVTNKNVRFCKYCEQGKFYILMEVNSGKSYSTVSYLFDSITKTLTQTTNTGSIVTTTTTTTPVTPTSKVEIVEPTAATVWEKGQSYNIKWLSNASYADLVKIELYQGIKLIDTLAKETANTGIFVWNIPETYENTNNYKIKITWLTAGDTSNFDVSDAFTLTNIPQTTTTTTANIQEKAIGVEYNKYTGQVIIVLSNGLMAIYDINDKLVMGLIPSGVNNATCMAINDRVIDKFRGVKKVRVYVGSDQHLSDKWDSGIIETDKTSMYYGGGNNLMPGERYYVNIQVYSSSYGWSEVQTKEFTMPK